MQHFEEVLHCDQVVEPVGLGSANHQESTDVGRNRDSGAVQRMVLRQLGVMIGIGASIGALVALGLGRAAQSMLYGLDGHDPAVFALVLCCCPRWHSRPTGSRRYARVARSQCGRSATTEREDLWPAVCVPPICA